MQLLKGAFTSFLLLVCLSQCIGQGLVGFKRSYIEKHLGRSYHKYQSETNVTPSTVSFSLKDSTVKSLTETYHFDANGRCDFQTETFDCDSCFKKFLNKELNNPFLKWIKLSSTKYISKFWRHYILEIDDEHFSYTIKKINLDKKQYNEMVETTAF